MTMKTRCVWVSVFAGLLLAGCAPGRPAMRPLAPVPTASPNGEPLPLQPGPDGCRAALTGWFARADANNDGVLNLAEMQADAERWFAQADLDHDGTITADELTIIRNRINPPAEPEEPSRIRPDPRKEERTGVRPRHSQLDPVMEADANTDFRVSAAEFRAHVESRFAARDPDRRGVINASQLQETCARQDRQ